MRISGSEFLIFLSKLIRSWRIFKGVVVSEPATKENFLCDVVLSTLATRSLFTLMYIYTFIATRVLVHSYICTTTHNLMVQA